MEVMTSPASKQTSPKSKHVGGVSRVFDFLLKIPCLFLQLLFVLFVALNVLLVFLLCHFRPLCILDVGDGEKV